MTRDERAAWVILLALTVLVSTVAVARAAWPLAREVARMWPW